MSQRSLHIAWIGFAPAEEMGGVPGIATDLLHGLAELGHRIDCFFPSHARELPARITGVENLTFVWGHELVGLEPVVQPNESHGIRQLVDRPQLCLVAPPC